MPRFLSNHPALQNALFRRLFDRLELHHWSDPKQIHHPKGLLILGAAIWQIRTVCEIRILRVSGLTRAGYASRLSSSCARSLCIEHSQPATISVSMTI